MNDKLILRVSDKFSLANGALCINVLVKSGKCNVGDVLILDSTGKEFKVVDIEEQSYGLNLMVTGLEFGDVERNGRIYKKGEEPDGFYENLANPVSCYYCGTRDFRGYYPGDVRDMIHKGIEGMACKRCEQAITITNRILNSFAVMDSDEEAIKVLNQAIEHMKGVVEDINQKKY